MIYSIKEFFDDTVNGMDGEAGCVSDFLLDDEFWVCRYLVIDVGEMFEQKQVCIPMLCLSEPFTGDEANSIELKLTLSQIRNAPGINDNEPVSRRMERQLAKHYAIPPYWGGGDIWGTLPTPGIPATQMVEEPAENVDENDKSSEDVHLRSAHELIGYSAVSGNDKIGRVSDLLVGSDAWQIRRILVDINGWLPGGLVPVEAEEIEKVSWKDQEFQLSVSKREVETRSQVKRDSLTNVG